MTTNVTLHAGHDVAYFTRGQEAGGCAGAMSYYTAAGEPPGQWAGTAARKSLGLTGQVDAGVLDRLFMKGIGPGGEILVKRNGRGKTPRNARRRRWPPTVPRTRTPARSRSLRSAPPSGARTRIPCPIST